MSTPAERDPSDRGPLPLLYTAAAIAVAVAVIGFVSGTRDPGAPPLPAATGPEAARDDREVPTYADMAAGEHGPNSQLYRGALTAGLPALTDEVVREGDLDALRERRASARAYAGAPPTIPHAIDQRSAPACLACHERGARIGDRIAPAMSHARYQSCVQCHAPQQSSVPSPPAPALTENGFVGMEAPTLGTRAWPGAPPTIPHATWMRERCDSCHGVSGASPMRSTHPARQSCTQCHVPDAARSQTQPRLEAAIERFGSGPPPVRRR